MTSSLVGSEMCIRDRAKAALDSFRQARVQLQELIGKYLSVPAPAQGRTCLLYTSDAADDM
eukprot:494888-Prorocentrum_lima.AAC.1